MVSPADVPEAKERRCAWVLYVVLLAAFVGYMAWTIADGIAQREDPPTSFEREEMTWNLPHIVAEGVRPTFGECMFSVATDDDDVERECSVEFYEDEDAEEGGEGVLVFFLGDFDIQAMRDEYEESASEDDPDFDESFIEGFVVLGFEEVGDLWEVPIGLCSAQEFPEEADRDYWTISDACPINTYVPIGAVREGEDSQAYASNFVLEAEVFRSLELDEEYSYTSSVSSTIWNVPSGELDDSFLLSVNGGDHNAKSMSSSSKKKNSHQNKKQKKKKSEKAPRQKSWHRKHKHKTPIGHMSSSNSSTQGAKLQQSSSILGYAGQVWVYQQGYTISVTEEQDPLDILALFGQWGGAFTYVAIIFGLVFTVGKGGVRYNRFSKESSEKYKRQPASKKAKGKKDKKKKKNKKKDKKEEDESEEDDDEDDDDDDEEAFEIDV